MINLLRENASYKLTLPDSDAKLWVAALDEKDPWFNYLNWETQFELTRFIQHKNSDKNTPLLYFCGQFLPAKMLLLVKNNNDGTWPAIIEEKWQNLGSVKAQIFLPKSIKRADFEKVWQPQFDRVVFVEGPP